VAESLRRVASGCQEQRKGEGGGQSAPLGGSGGSPEGAEAWMARTSALFRGLHGAQTTHSRGGRRHAGQQLSRGPAAGESPTRAWGWMRNRGRGRLRPPPDSPAAARAPTGRLARRGSRGRGTRCRRTPQSRGRRALLDERQNPHGSAAARAFQRGDLENPLDRTDRFRPWGRSPCRSGRSPCRRRACSRAAPAPPDCARSSGPAAAVRLGLPLRRPPHR